MFDTVKVAPVRSNNRHNQSVGSVHRHSDVVEAIQYKVVTVDRGIELRESDDRREHGFDDQNL